MKWKLLEFCCLLGYWICVELFGICVFLGIAAEEGSGTMSVDIIRRAYEATEEGFLSIVARQWPMKPQLAAVGSCCLTGLICDGKLYIANLGDSRAVLGRTVRATGEVLAMQLSEEHNASIESVRQELHSLHPDDSQIVVLRHNVWRVKGLIQVEYLQDIFKVPILEVKVVLIFPMNFFNMT